MATRYTEDITSLVRGPGSQEDDTDPDYAEVRQIMAREACSEKEAREMLAAQRRNERRVTDAYNEMVLREHEKLRQEPDLASAAAEDVFTYSIGPLGALGYNLLKEGLRGGPPSSPDIATDLIGSSGGKLPALVDVLGRSLVGAFVPGLNTANAIRGISQGFRNAQPPPGPGMSEAHHRDTTARAIEEANRGPAGRPTAPAPPSACPQSVAPVSPKDAAAEQRRAVLRQVRPNAFVGMMVDAGVPLDAIEGDLLGAGVSKEFTGRLMDSARVRRQRQLEAQRPRGGGGSDLYGPPWRRPLVQ